MAFNWFTPKPGARRREAGDTASADHAAAPLAGGGGNLSWPDVVRQMGQEVAMSLNAASEQLERLNTWSPAWCAA